MFTNVINIRTMRITKTLTLASKILNGIYFGNCSLVVTENLEVANKHQSALSLRKEGFAVVLRIINKSLCYLIQVDLHIQEFRLVKSPGNFKKDSECQNQNMWTTNCK